jgi:hypothetical protein
MRRALEVKRLWADRRYHVSDGTRSQPPFTASSVPRVELPGQELPGGYDLDGGASDSRGK